MSSIVYSVGLGPGDPELITLKAKRILEGSDIVVVPQSDELGRSVARDIILHYIDASRIFMYYFPMNNNREDLNRRYSELAERIKEMLDHGKTVSYVTMGDPTIYSTSIYLTERLIAAGIDVIHIPGISSINAASSLLGIPLCMKREDFGVYEMPEDVERAVELIQRHSTAVFMKINSKLPVLVESVKRVMPRQAFLVRRIGLDGEGIYDILNNEPPQEPAYLSVAVVKRRERS